MNTTHFIDVWPNILLFDLMRYLIPASIFFMLFWVIGKRWWQHLFIQNTFPKQIQLWKEFGYSMSTVIIFSLVGYCLYSAEHAGITMIYHEISAYGIGYFILSLFIMIAFHDFYFYWTHRLMHHALFFRHVHKVHHASTNPSPWAAYSFHPWEALIQAMVLPIAVFMLPLHPLTIFIFLTYMILRNVLGHLGFEILPKGFTRNKWFNWNTSITHHNMHHQYFNSNYGLYFTWWDNAMKTTHNEYHQTFEEVKGRPKACQLKSASPKSITLPMVLLVLHGSTLAQSVSGTWMTYSEATGSPLSLIEIKETSTSVEGIVAKVFLEPHQGEDPACTMCTGERKDKKVVSMNTLWGFHQQGDSWSKGKILDPENGEIYSSKLWLEDNNTLRVRGYAGPFDLFYRTQTWKRAAAAGDKTPVGTWQTMDDRWNQIRSIIEIKSVDGELRGYIRKIYLLPHEGTDPLCIACEGSMKNSRIVGMKIIWDLKKEGNKWEDGKILDPGNGTVYAAALWLIDAQTLKVRGYLGPFYRSQIWKRVQKAM